MNTTKKRRVFPFTAVIGQEEMKLALLLNVIDPRIGGVMIMGDRGTGKSTTIRALADLLPAIEVVKDDPYNSSLIDPDLQSKEVLEKVIQGENLESTQKQVPMVDLPLGATEDRLCGTIDIEKALSEGIKAFEPGLLAKANRGLLYVDEVNLLDDHLVDVLLDSAASGCCACTSCPPYRRQRDCHRAPSGGSGRRDRNPGWRRAPPTARAAATRAPPRR